MIEEVLGPRVCLGGGASRASQETKECRGNADLQDLLDFRAFKAVLETEDRRAPEASRAAGVKTGRMAGTASTENRGRWGDAGFQENEETLEIWVTPATEGRKG